MKYVSYIPGALLSALILGSLGGCAFNGDKESWNYDGSRAVELQASDRFLPIQERDADSGEVLPYDAEPNPYAALNGRIDKTAITLYIDAQRAYTARKFELAEQLLGELIEQEPKLSGPWVLRGDIAMANDDMALAVEHYAAALKVKPINFNAHLRLAKAQRMRGHFHHAQNTYIQALTEWPDGAELHLNLGVLYDLYLNRPLEAQAHMEAYQLLSGDNHGEVSAWLEEIRGRTDVASALKVKGPDGDLEIVTPAGKKASTESQTVAKTEATAASEQ